MATVESLIAKIVENEMQEILDTLCIESPNTGYRLAFSADGVWEITDNGKLIKRYKRFSKAIEFMMANN